MQAMKALKDLMSRSCGLSMKELMLSSDNYVAVVCLTVIVTRSLAVLHAVTPCMLDAAVSVKAYC